MKLAILPIGSVDIKALQIIKTGLCKAFSRINCKILEDELPVPEDTYNSRRGQYNSTELLVKIKDFTRKYSFDRVLGVTDVDLYAPDLNFVFGEAYNPGKIALISLARLKQEFYDLPTDNELFSQRAIKEAVHEIGHTMGLRHCKDHSCVMFYSNSIIDTDNKKATFCEKCHSSNIL